MRNRVASISIYADLCKGCGICIASCSFGVFEMSRDRGRQGYLLPKVVHPESCRGCLLCELACPDMAIEIVG